MTIWRGLTLVINDGAPIAGFDQGYRWWGRGELLGISIPIWIFAIVAVGGYLALHKTRWGASFTPSVATRRRRVWRV